MEKRMEYSDWSTWYSDKAKAESIAAECNKTSDGWIYKVVDRNNGWHAIAVFDEENFFLGEL